MFQAPSAARQRVPVRTLRYKKPHAKLTLGNTTIFVSWCLGVKYDAMDNRLTQRHQATREDHSGRAAVCSVARARVVPHRTRTGTCSRRRPRRGNVSRFEPDGQPRGAAPPRGFRWPAPTRRLRVPILAALKGRPRIARGGCVRVFQVSMRAILSMKSPIWPPYSGEPIFSTRPRVIAWTVSMLLVRTGRAPSTPANFMCTKGFRRV